jgi:hypothetical protein
VVELGEELGFALESRQALLVFGEAAGSTLTATSRFSLVSVAR